MKLISLYSGAKDSTYSILLEESRGNKVEYLLTLVSENKESYMFHTANIEHVKTQAELMNKKLVLKKTKGEKEKELKDLEDAVSDILSEDKDIQGVVCGAVASEYQRQRVEHICKKFNLSLLAPLWHCNEEKTMQDMIEKMDIIISCVAADGLTEDWLGRKIDNDCLNDLKDLKKTNGVHLMGEGGEYETFVLYCPLFSKKIKITESEKHWQQNSGFLEIKKIDLV